ncbi:MAG: hypothetical protein BAJATHORv1_50079 [Candidatus Thorarchaeota archaeon]|nr:MAG: hypothetical protein BAJATHORv1_50079 [Candidatus Thorarchaeota archaeon]
MEIVVVGHLSRDLIITPDLTRESLGGAPAYAMIAPAIGALGAGIVSRIGSDFEQSYLNALYRSGLDLTGLRTSQDKSTRFINIYNAEGERTQRIESIAPPIHGYDYLPKHLLASIFHFSPLTPDEIHISCIETAKSSGALVSLDVQGYLRNISGENVTLSRWEYPDEVLKFVDIVKAEESEVKFIFEAKTEVSAVSRILSLGPRVVIITRSQKGSTIYTRNNHVDIPLVLADKFIDSTGCGDVYSIGFLLSYMRTGDVSKAGLFGATCASFNLESIGPYNPPSIEQVEERMRTYLHG